MSYVLLSIRPNYRVFYMFIFKYLKSKIIFKYLENKIYEQN